MPDGTIEKPTYEDLEARIAALEREKLQLRHELLQTQVQLMDAALMSIQQQRPRTLAELAEVRAILNPKPVEGVTS